MTDLKSTISHEMKSKTVTQIIHFIGGIKRTFYGILPKSLKQGQFTKFQTLDGRIIMINDENVLCVEVFEED